MAENIVIYAGLDKVGRLKKRAIEREAKRAGHNGSVSGLIWSMFRKYGSLELKKELAAAERMEVK